MEHFSATLRIRVSQEIARSLRGLYAQEFVASPYLHVR
jgi:hypothetical protein